MAWFNKSYDLSLIQTSSKDALKRSALFVCNGDIEEAEKLYHYFAKDITDMPAYDPPQISGFEQIKQNALGLFDWVDNNQDKLLNYVSIFKSLRAGETPVTTVQTPADIPALP